MTVVWLLVRGELRRRWGSWVVLGLLAGVSVGLACAGIAGARRTDWAVPHYAEISNVPDAAILANDPAFDEDVQAQVAALPYVTRLSPFLVPFLLEVTSPQGMVGPLLPTTPGAMESTQSPVIAGRLPDPNQADEIAVNEQARDAFGLDVGSTMVLVQEPPPEDFPFPVPPESSRRIEQVMRVVGVMDGAGSEEPDAMISSAFYETYREQIVGAVNAFVDLRDGSADLELLRQDVDRLVGHPVNTEDAADLFGVRQLLNVSTVEATGLWLFAITVLVGAGALVGQALVRAVSARAADARTWRAIGVDHRLARRAVFAPALLSAGVAAVVTVAVAVLLSPRFPIALTRRFDLDAGFHGDWVILVPGALFVVLAIAATAWITALLSLRPKEVEATASRPPRWPIGHGLPPSMLVGSRLATDSGRGRRAVPVRSALVGAIAGVIGVVGCLTFRNGLSDTVADPTRSGVVWDQYLAKAGLFTDDEIASLLADEAVGQTIHATWARGILLNGTATPTFGVDEQQGGLQLLVTEGTAPASADEVAMAPRTMDALNLEIGDDVTVGASPGRRAVVVGRALLPSTSHTDYDQGAWMTSDGLMAAVPDLPDEGADFFEDYLLLAWKPGADAGAAQERLRATVDGSIAGVYATEPAELPASVASLEALRVLPLALAVFFALLAVATVAHALVTTVRRRRVDLAILLALGFTRRDARLAIAWQATLLAMLGVLVGVPVGIVVGRLLWRQFAESFPLAYAPPLAIVAIVVAAPIAILIANALAVGPARSATRARPAEVLRTE